MDGRAAAYHPKIQPVPQQQQQQQQQRTAPVSPSHAAGFLGKEADGGNWLQHAQIKPKRRRRKANLGGNGSLLSVTFLTNVLRWRGTVVKQVLLPSAMAAVVAGLWSLCLLVINDKEAAGFPSLPLEAFLPLALGTLCLCAYRLFVACANCAQGKELVRAMGHSAEEMVLVCVTSPIVRESGMDLQEICRKINILLAFVRQDLRESRQHEDSPKLFRRGSVRDQLALQAFFTTPLHYAQDPHGAPPLIAMLSQEEIDYYSNFKPNARVLVLVAELSAFFKHHVNYGSAHMTTPEGKVFERELRRIRDAWSTCGWVVKTPAPYALHHFTLVSIFVFTIAIAPLYFATHKGSAAFGAWMSCPLAFFTAALYYGFEAAAECIEVPFGWGESDCNLTAMCRSVLKNTATLFKVREAIDRGLNAKRNWETWEQHSASQVSASTPLSAGGTSAAQGEQSWGTGGTAGSGWQ